MVTFTIDTAVKVVEHYKFLIGKSLDEREDITNVNYIVIAPYYSDGLEEFWYHFNKEEDNAIALGRSKHDKNKVLIFLVSMNNSSGNTFHEELDNNLTARGIEKIYNSDGSLKAP